MTIAPRPTPFVFPAIARRVIDGDTIEADIDRGWNDWSLAVRIRLLDCWAPESRGPARSDAGQSAKEFLQGLVKPGDRLLVASIVKTDAFGRVLAHVWVGDVPTTINELMVTAGHATVCKPPAVEALGDSQRAAATTHSS